MQGRAAGDADRRRRGLRAADRDVDAGESFDLEVVNDTRRCRPSWSPTGRPARVAGQTSTRQIDALEAGDHRVTLEGAPFEATLRAPGRLAP